MSSQLGFYPKFHGTDPSTGMPLVGGFLYTYAAGTSTPLATYADAGLTTPNANPVVLDAAGEALVYCACTAYKFVLQNSLGVQLWSVDNYSPCAAGGGGGGGSVTSVGLAATSEFTVTGSPVTGSGTLTLGKANENANTVWAGPTSGAAAQPTFRALVAADIPAGIGGGGTLKSQYFSSSGTFTPPTGVTGVWISGAGGGGGGSSQAATAGSGGGGSGEECVMQPVVVSGPVTVTIGAGGAGATAGGGTAAGSNGGTTSFGTSVLLLGGIGAPATTAGGPGGGPNGGLTGGSSSGTGTQGGIGLPESPTYFGGSAGGGGGGGASSIGGRGGANAGYALGASGGAVANSASGGGSGGTSSRGVGGVGGNGGTAGSNGTNPGSGGGGAGGATASNFAGGNGADGWLAVFWVG